MRSNSKARISGLAVCTHAQNGILPDLPSAWPWEIWDRVYSITSSGNLNFSFSLMYSFFVHLVTQQFAGIFKIRAPFPEAPGNDRAR